MLSIAACAFLLLAPDAAALTSHAMRAYYRREFTQAERYAREALASNPGYVRARLALARTLIEEDKVPIALEELQRALEMQPVSPDTEFEAGRILEMLAESRFARLQQLAPHSADVRELAGRQWEARGDLPKALAEYRAALSKDPARPGLHFRIGNVLWKMRDNEAALAELLSEIQRNPGHTLANLRAGQALLAADQADRAIPLLERAARNSPEAKRELGKALAQVGRRDEARKVLEEAAAALPRDESVHMLLGRVCRALGDEAAARREFSLHREILARKRAAAQKQLKASQTK